MANEKFKVKFGLAVGDTVATIDGTSGDIVTTGDVAVNGGDVTTTQTTGSLFNATATTVNIGGAATTMSIGANTGTTTINNSLVADDISITTIDATNIEVTNIKAKDGTAAMTIADSTGVVSVSTALNVDNINIATNTISSTDTNGNITLTPNGTGDVILSTDTVQVGDSNATATITTNGTGNLVLNTNNGTNAGTLTLANGANGVITLDPNGTGNVAVTFANGGNLTNDRNYVFGAIRNATTAGIGDIWALNVTGTVQPNRGVNLDNSADTTKMPATVLRTYNSTSTNRGFLVFEKARGTAASPTAVQSGDIFGSIIASGCNGAGTFINDTTTAAPVIVNFSAAENFVSNTNIGGSLAVLMAPTATTVTGIGSLVTVIAANPQTFACRSDSYTWSNGKTGTTQRMSLDVSGNLIVSGDLTVTGNDIKNSGGSNVITMTSGNTQTTINTTQLNVNNPTTATSYLNNSNIILTTGDPAGAAFNDRVSQIRVTTASTTSGEASTITFNTGNYNTGTNVFSATASGDTLGEFFFGGQYGTTSSFTTLGPSVRFTAKAAEAFTATNSGGTFSISLDKIGGNTSYDAFGINSSNATLSSNEFAVNSNLAVNYATINATSAKFATPVRTTITSATVAKGGTFTPAVTAMNSIILEITAGSGTTTIDVSNLTVAGENAVFDIMVYNNSGGSINANALLIINGGNTALDHGATISNGTRAMFQVNCVDIYANAIYLGNAV